MGLSLGRLPRPWLQVICPSPFRFPFSFAPRNRCNIHFNIYIYIYKDLGNHMPLQPRAPVSPTVMSLGLGA
jgi:hypothetical protein